MLGDLTGFDRRLDHSSGRPLVLALSGGGDSMALLGLAADWARRHGRRLLALTVDHQLNPESPRWTDAARRAARAAGAEWRELKWDGPKPSTGVSAAARRARHALLAAAAREAGAGVILMAHTADDRLEGDWMRANGSTLGRLREWAPSPLWPEGRGLMILRPLLDVRRQALRAFLRERGQDWIDDPANTDPRSLRARARAATAAREPAPLKPEPHAACALKVDPVSGAVSGPASDSWLAQGVCVASGREAPPAHEGVERLRARIETGEPFQVTLSGARIAFDGARLLMAREPGRRGLEDLTIRPGWPVVWDGRFEVTARTPGWRIGALRSHQAKLDRPSRETVRMSPPLARPARPVLFREGEARPLLAGEEVQVHPLGPGRLAAATQGVDREADLAAYDMAPR